MIRTLALTGATGFIGRVLRRRIAQAGFRVRALTRRTMPGENNVEWLYGSLEDGPALARLVDGADAVVHCAGIVRGATSDVFHSTNVEGSQRMGEAARAGGLCRRFLLLSSLAARHPTLSWYAASKRDAELILGARLGDIPLTVFRPTAVYGPGDRELRPMLTTLLRGWLIIPGNPEGRVTFLHVDDLADAVVRWLQAPEPPQGVFELHDGRPGGYDWPALASIAGDIRCGPVRTVSVPGPLLTGIAGANLMLSRLLGHAPMLTPAKLRELQHADWSCDNGPLERALNWRPTLSLARALAQKRF